MIQNFLITAWRNIWRNKSFSVLNILGLTAGTVCCFCILLYVNDQYGYDIHHHEAESLYRLRTIIEPRNGAKEFNSATSSPPIAMTMKQDFPEVIAATRIQYFQDQGDYLLSLPGESKAFYEPKGYLVDSTFFQVFDYKFIEGTPLHSLDEPYTVILSSALAKKLFGNTSVLNKQVIIGDRSNSNPFKVTGVFDEHFGKSHLKPHFLMNMNSGGLGEFIRTNNQWAGQNFVFTYLRLNPNASGSALQEKLPAFLQKYGAGSLKELGMKKHLLLQKVTDIHLLSKGITNQIDKVSDSGFLNLLLTIAFFIQLIACINFINLTTARSIKRAREIGVRKVVGAGKSLLVFQFLGEAMIISLLAVCLAIPVLILLLPFFNQITDSGLTISSLLDLKIFSLFLALALLTGLLSGLYPAFYLSGFRPVNVLKGKIPIGASTIHLRKGLVVLQFVIATVLIVSVVIISRQIRYLQSRDLGFNQKQRIVIPFKDDVSQRQFFAFENEIRKISQVKNTGGCAYYPSQNVLSDLSLYKSGKDMNSAQLVRFNRSTEDYFKTLGIKIIAGRNLKSTDTMNQMVVNEKTIELLGIDKDQAVGSRLYADFEGTHNEFEIIGVTGNYNFKSLRDEIEPLATFFTTRPAYMVVESETTDYKSLLSDIGLAWRKLIDKTPFEYSFLDQDIQKLYVEENTLRKISNAFTLLAILISCLGLFGLAMFTAQQRVKEIGIRKVLGASVGGIVALVSKDFIKLVLISILIASPIAWWIMNHWLDDYAYKIQITIWVFVLAGLLAILVALLTVSFQAIKAAIANPVKSLRTE